MAVSPIATAPAANNPMATAPTATSPDGHPAQGDQPDRDPTNAEQPDGHAADRHQPRGNIPQGNDPAGPSGPIAAIGLPAPDRDMHHRQIPPDLLGAILERPSPDRHRSSYSRLLSGCVPVTLAALGQYQLPHCRAEGPANPPPPSGAGSCVTQKRRSGA